MQEDERRQRQAEEIRATCARRGIAIVKRGQTFHLVAPGVSVLATDLADLNAMDLTPYQPRKHIAP